MGRDSQKGKNLYRLKSLIRFLPIHKNDRIVLNKQEYLVETISKKNVTLRDNSGNKLIKNYSYFFNEKITKKNE